ncbi:MAG: SCO family protein [Hyphomicrobiales bacterium]
MRYAPAVFLTVFALFSGPATAVSPEDEALRISRAAIGARIPDLTFQNIDKEPVKLSDFEGKPLVISLVYTACADVCPAVIDNLYPAIEAAQSALGKDSFSVVTVGFDVSQDSPERMRSFARTRGIDLPNWHFLSGDNASVSKLIKVVGFTIVPSAGGFDHMAQVSMVDADGTVYQQIYGGTFSAPALVEPLKDLVYDRKQPLASVAGIIERVKLFCTVYNPNTGRYYFNYSLFMGIAIGLACLLLVLGWLIREFRRSDGPGTGHA